MPDFENIPEQIVDAITDKNLIDIGVDVSEVGLDKFLSEGFLKDLPAIGILFKSLNLAKNLRDRIFLAKVAKFLLSLNNVPFGSRKKFREKISKDSHFKKKVGETLLLILERLDNMEKPEMVAKVFKAYLIEKITISDFYRLASAIDIAFIDDLRHLLGIKIETGIHNYKENLVKAGLFKINVKVDVKTNLQHFDSTKKRALDRKIFDGKTETYINYSLSELGYLFLEVMKEE